MNVFPCSHAGGLATFLRAAAAGFLLITTFLCGCSTPLATGKGASIDGGVAATAKPAPTGRGQLVVVIGGGEGVSRARLYAYQRAGESWSRQFGPLPAMVGRNGFAPPGEKVEGDGKSPSGIFPLELAFGYATQAPTRMPYRQATGDDLWVDDVNSPQYNTWVRKGETAAKSYEEMLQPDGLYRYGIVIGYNRYPIVKGKGSAIFMHIWRGDGKPTAGCVALDEDQLVRIIGWLDPASDPMIVMGNEKDIIGILRSVGITGAP